MIKNHLELFKEKGLFEISAVLKSTKSFNVLLKIHTSDK